MIVSLIKGDIPYDLGENTRPEALGTGIQPYLDYLIDDILLPSRSRSFVDPGQRWKLIAKSLEALTLVLERYPLVPDDDRLRNLGLESMQRRLVSNEMRGVMMIIKCGSETH